ncbi:peptidylprolyl isomerase [Shewanella marina]|uniref:peptidylprolyl isomerase n=1 Tax=Shewanella marina TaxID=487319 RepID=UPI001F305259|nr:peptidylprolyl isomerase [Shewanella marina]
MSIKTGGGRIRQISRNQTVPEFERQVLQYEQGLIAEPITSRYGIHVVNIVNKITGEQLDYPHVEDKIRGYLVDRASRLAIQSYIYNLIEVADIQGIEVGFEPSANIAV